MFELPGCRAPLAMLAKRCALTTTLVVAGLSAFAEESAIAQTPLWLRLAAVFLAVALPGSVLLARFTPVRRGCDPYFDPPESPGDEGPGMTAKAGPRPIPSAPASRVLRAGPGACGTRRPIATAPESPADATPADLSTEGPRYRRASECAAQIANLLSGDEYPGGRARLHSRLTFLILETLYAVESDLGRDSYRPSDN